MSEEFRLIMDELDKLNAKVTDIQLTLENETNKNMRSHSSFTLNSRHIAKTV